LRRGNAAFGAISTGALRRIPAAGLERGDFSSNRHVALAICLRMIFPENRVPLFGIML
jgi:hypothetical protein